MILLSVRLFAVYAASAALALLLASRFVRPIRLRTAILLAAAPLLLVGKAFVTAGVVAPIDIAYDVQPLAPFRAEVGIDRPRTPVLVDVVQSYLPWRAAVRESLENGRLPLWNRFTLAGEPLLAVQEPAAFHPFTWIGFLLPLAQSWTLGMALRLLLAFLCAYLFFRELDCADLSSLFGAAGWALCDFLVFHLGYPLSPAAAVLPLVLLGLTRLVRAPGRGAVALIVLPLLLVVLAGHPETLLHVVAAGGLWFLFELARADRGRRWKPLSLSLLGGALSLGLSAVVLLPFFEILPHTREHAIRTQVHARADRSVPVGTAARLAVQNAMPYAFGVSGRGSAAPGFELPSGYAGALVLPLAAVGLASRRREKWVFLLFVALGVALHARLPVVADAVASLPLFELALNERLAFVAAFGSVALAVLGAEGLGQARGQRVFLVASVAAVVLLGVLFTLRLRRFDELAMPRDYALHRLALQLAPLVLAAALIALARARMAVAVVALVSIFAVTRVVETAGVYPTYPARAFYPPLPIVEKIPKDAPWRTAPIGYVFPPNMPAMYRLEDVRGYVSLTLAPLAETFSLWCVPRPVEWNRVAEPTTPFLSFLNVRYVLAPSAYRTVPPGWTLLAEGREGRLLENPRALPRAFAPRKVRYEESPVRQLELLRGIRDFAEEGIVEDAAPPAGSWVSNGPAEVRITRYAGGDLSVEIGAKNATVVGTSIPRWPGWKLTVDGREEPLLRFNRAFIAFRVPPGRHTAALEYRPDGFVRGAAVSGATFLFALGLLAPRKRALG